jgi:DNA-binding GntR family transcriptional regulator
MKRISRQSLASIVASELRQAILGGRLIPGDRIQQDQLATELGVSRLPVRQAILILEAEGLVQTEHRRGSIVAPIDITFIEQIYEFRAEVDARVAAVLAARRDFNPTPLRDITDEAFEAIRTDDRQRFTERKLSFRFYAALYAATGNRVLTSTMTPLLGHIHRVLLSLSSSQEHVKDEYIGDEQLLHWWENHAALVEAIAAGRIGRARALARAHPREVGQAICKNLAAMLQRATSARHTSDRSPRNVPRVVIEGERAIVHSIEKRLTTRTKQTQGPKRPKRMETLP